MIIFGWLCLLALTMASSIVTLIVTHATLGFSGKIGGESAFFAVVSGLLIWATCANFPFVVQVAS